MAEWIKVILLGIIEGITEFLPISSTGHLLVVAALLDFNNSVNGTFEIFIQIGAVVAVMSFYHQDLWHQARTIRTDPTVQRLWLMIAVAAAPVGIVGLYLHPTIKKQLFSQTTISMAVVAMMLILGGFIFLIVDHRVTTNTKSTTNTLSNISLRQALIIGIAQIPALIPGISRSGAAIVGGLLAGLDRPTATTFSFYLAIPVLGGATILDLLLSLDQVNTGELFYLLLGALVSGIIAWFAIGWLLRYVARNNFTLFAIYRVATGIAILVLVILGLL